MALYLPDLHVAFEITDDPSSAPVDSGAFPDLLTVNVTQSQLNDPGILAKAIERAQDAAAERTPASARKAASFSVSSGFPAPASARKVAIQAVRAAARLC